ncbi:MAG: glycosyltransferase family 4 protein [Candidatus Sungbacteria bacterium]|nr:glycosyltransferase family 4 protein [Candidatus Sungbacteria bacterium]
MNLLSHIRQIRPDVEFVVLTSVGSGHPLERPILSPSRFRLVSALPAIRVIVKGCDLIHTLDSFPYGVIAAAASLGLGKKLIITAIGTGAIQPFNKPLPGWLLRRAYRRADRIIAISNYTRREILRREPNLAIDVINHAVDFRDFESSSDAELTPDEFEAIQKLKPYALSVGGWKERKGFEYSFAAFAEVSRHFPRLNYVAVGIGPKRHLTEPLGITGKCFFFKGIRWPFLKAIYRHAELFFLLPYNDRGDVEGFGFAFLEAAAAGLPVVGARESGVEDAVRDSENGFLVEPRSAPAAAAAISRVLADPALESRMRAASLAFAREMNWDKVARRYLNIYREVLRREF